MAYPTGWEQRGYFAAQLGPEPVAVDWTAPMREAGIVPPRPLQLGDILGGAFRAVRFAPVTMFGLTLVVLLVAQLLGMGAGYVLGQQFGGLVPFEEDDLGTAALFSWTTITGALANGLTAVVVGMGLLYAVFHAVSARRVSPAEALRQMGSRMGAALGFSALTGLAVAAVAGLSLAIVVPAFADDDGTGALAVLGLIVLIGIPGVWISTRLLLAPCAITVERLGPVRAIVRSWRLSRGMFWRIFGIYLLASVIISMAASTVSTVFSLAAMLLAIQDVNLAMLVMSVVSSLVSTILSLPLTTAVTGLLYVDARIRQEGYDLQLSEALYG